MLIHKQQGTGNGLLSGQNAGRSRQSREIDKKKKRQKVYDVDDGFSAVKCG